MWVNLPYMDPMRVEEEHIFFWVAELMWLLVGSTPLKQDAIVEKWRFNLASPLVRGGGEAKNISFTTKTMYIIF